MKINGFNNNKYIKLNTYNANNKKANENKVEKENSVKVEISDSAKALLEKINSSNDTEYSEKVEKIRKAIIDGNYKVSSQDIADKVIRTIEEQKGRDI